MRLHVVSDLHLEFGPCDLPKVDADCMILAGDIHVKKNGLQWIRAAYSEIPVVYVLGNHEFYGEKFPNLADKLQEEAAGRNIHVLENRYVEIAGMRIFGCTLWTDMALHGDSYIGSIEARQMNDYKRIRHSATYRKLLPNDTRVHHAHSIVCLKNFLQSGDPRRSLIVTHHAPSPLSLPQHRRSELISCAYASHLEDLIRAYSPLVWVHGHIHQSQNYTIGSTLVIANPRGYADEANVNFIPDYVTDA